MIGIIGGSGFIGTRLVDRMLKAGEKVRIIDKNKSEKHPQLWTFGDVRDVDSLTKALGGVDSIINLAAEHKDNVRPLKLYYDTNVQGAINICEVADKFGIKKLVFTSSVAVYGFTTKETDETGKLEPFNEYGRTKMLAEAEYKKWYEADPESKTLVFIRPTVVFGEGNRQGNVYTLMKQTRKNSFIIGNGKNIKSMAYVENVAAFIEYCTKEFTLGFHLFNYIDKPDYNMIDLMKLLKRLQNNNTKLIKVPYFIGYAAGGIFDLLSKITKREYEISRIRIKKFCSSSHFTSSNMKQTEFEAPVSIEEGLQNTIEDEFDPE
ncbi:NAD-dependent epimerase/dehydratase family protein [Mesotoga sp. UBA5557]|jgi:nucleoside-diphosphate-sugar epimerase|uniref:NAD-dependent epimerase/dehydratase family protein n=1 Tax=Mesotoga sp. UBA5557 TaxID=1946857 RepID=UPI0025D2E395|nr:NAD-dependent epimerase/dehydratase family protein [Mesotoga sp. UBA5557]